MLCDQSIPLMMDPKVRIDLKMDERFELKQRDEDGSDGNDDEDAFGDWRVYEACNHIRIVSGL